jgi:murein L,D-transpeptidase YafK
VRLFRLTHLLYLLPCLLVVGASASVKPMEIPQGNRIVVEKSRHLMHVYHDKESIVTFRIALGRQPVGQKNCAGDNRTPEGIYTITEHKKDSAFYRALRISYPSAQDIARAKSKGCNPGGNIMIHGLKNGYGWAGRTHRTVDWTNGCIAITNQEMDILYNMVKDGATVEIKP